MTLWKTSVSLLWAEEYPIPSVLFMVLYAGFMFGIGTLSAAGQGIFMYFKKRSTNTQ